MRNRKHLLFGTMGFFGGVLGALLAEVVSAPRVGGFFSLLFHSALWVAAFSSILALGLFWAGEIYHRRPIWSPKTVGRALLVGAVAGLISGGVAQALYSVPLADGWARDYIFRSSCWALMGGILGSRLSTVVPNLGKWRGACAGAVGGGVGGVGFMMVASSLAEAPGRALGIGILGLALGLAVVVVEELFREAYLEIIWAPKETTTVTLGERPVFIGGGEDEVFVGGLPEHAGGVVIDGGRIFYIDGSSGNRTAFRDGSRIQIGRIEIVVHAK